MLFPKKWKIKALSFLMVLFSFSMAAEPVDEQELEQLFSTELKLFSQKVVSLAEKYDGYPNEEKAIVRFYQAHSNWLNGNLSKAEQYFTQVLTLTKRPELKFKTYAALVNLLGNSGNYSSAFKHAFVMMDYGEGITDYDSVARSLGVYATLLLESGLFDEAKYVIDRIDISKVKSDKVKCGSVSVIYYAIYKSGKSYYSPDLYNPDLNFCLSNKQEIYGLLSYAMLSRFYLEHGEPNKSINILEDYYEQVIKFGYPNLKAIWLANLTDYWLQQQNPGKAAEYAQLLAAVTGIRNSLTAELITFNALTKSAKANGEIEQYAGYLEELYRVYTESNNRQLTAALAYHAALMQASQRKKEIESLSLQAGRLELENALNKAEAENNRLYLGLVAILAILLASMLFRLHRTRIKLKERVTYDKLTQVFSRDHFEETLDIALQQAQNRQQDLGFILFDLDHFKQVNDSYGHPVGDWVLRKAAAAARECLRKTDAIGRVGGEEFAILLPDCDLTQSLMLAENVRQAIEALDTGGSGHQFKITASLGVAMARDSDYHVRRLLCEADERMYQAKRAGRNQVMPEEPFSVS